MELTPSFYRSVPFAYGRDVHVIDLDYYDVVLVGIAASMLAGVLIGLVTPVSTEAGIVVGTVAATLFVYAGTFRNPPLPDAPPSTKTAIVIWHAVALVVIVAQYA